jgi:solute carrier family 39 (zinc transporter), member 7
MSDISITTTNVNSAVALAAFTSTALISIAPNVLLLLFPHYASGEGTHSFVLSLGQAIAAGGLLGDVFLHIIPHSATASTAAAAVASSSSSHHHADHSSAMGLCILLGFGIFLIIDMTLRQLNSSTGNNQHGHHHHHSNNDKETNARIQEDSNNNKKSLVLLNLAADALHNVSF